MGTAPPKRNPPARGSRAPRARPGANARAQSRKRTHADTDANTAPRAPTNTKPRAQKNTEPRAPKKTKPRLRKAAEPRDANAAAGAARTAAAAAKGRVRAGIGGRTYAPWRGAFYPEGLKHTGELGYASRALPTLEINGTYYSTFKPATFAKWRDETPEDFVFAVKASRYCTNRRVLAEAGPSIERFVNQGLAELGPKLGPIGWQFMPTKTFDADDFAAFLALLPREIGGLRLRHALEVRHPSFKDPRFVELARAHGAAIVFADSETFPAIDEPTADFAYARLMRTRDDEPTGYAPAELDAWAARAKGWAARGEAFVYFISGAKVRAPAAALALMERV